MNKPTSKRVVSNLILSTILCGLAVGWLTGLSVSPVVHIVLGALISLFATAAATIAGFRVKDEDLKETPLRLEIGDIDLRPLAILAVSICVGTSVGIYARTNDWLGIRPQAWLARWETSGINREELIRALLQVATNENAGHEQGKPEERTPIISPSKGVLFSVSSDEMARYQTASDNDIQKELLSSRDERIRNFAKSCKDPQILRSFVNNILCAK